MSNKQELLHLIKGAKTSMINDVEGMKNYMDGYCKTTEWSVIVDEWNSMSESEREELASALLKSIK